MFSISSFILLFLILEQVFTRIYSHKKEFYKKLKQRQVNPDVVFSVFSLFIKFTAKFPSMSNFAELQLPPNDGIFQVDTLLR